MAQYLVTDKHTSDLLDLIKQFTLDPKQFEANLKVFFAVSQEEQMKQDAARAVVVSADRIAAEHYQAKEDIQKAQDELNEKIRAHQAQVKELDNDRSNHVAASKTLNDRVAKHNHEVARFSAERDSHHREVEGLALKRAELKDLQTAAENKLTALAVHEARIKDYEQMLKDKAKKLKEQFADI